MNDYRITYTTKDDETYSEVYTERSEAAAKKGFTVRYKGLGLTITGIELVNENTCATKQQERDTLEAIKKMIAELGPQSYLATAFDGCFEDAEDNIDDDAAYSYKGRYEHVRRQLEEAQAEIDAITKKLADATEAVAQKDEEIRYLKATALSEDDLVDCGLLAEEAASENEAAEKKAAETIVMYAETPQAAVFLNAVKEHRTFAEKKNHYQSLRVKIRNTIHAGA